MSGAIGAGHFVSWDGGCMFIGHAHDVTPLHAHYAVQVAFGAERGIRFRPSDRDDWTEYSGVVIPSRQPHAMDATHVDTHAVLFVDPETREGRALVERWLHGNIAGLPDDALVGVGAALFDAWRTRRSASRVAAAARAVVTTLAGGIAPSVVSDQRILRATAYIRDHLDQPLTLDAVAAEACLSPSRFRHLFVEQTGMALRPYILWRRFLLVWDMLVAGESISTAAHRAGFADAAHLTRTSRRAFGFPPSALLMAAPLPADDRDAPIRDIAPQPLRSIGDQSFRVS